MDLKPWYKRQLYDDLYIRPYPTKWGQKTNPGPDDCSYLITNQMSPRQNHKSMLLDLSCGKDRNSDMSDCLSGTSGSRVSFVHTSCCNIRSLPY